jgi:glycosyltransferase involved in cell wall biosynthesis
MMPTLSVVIPTHNREKYLAQAINSVLRQSYRDYEIIVVDDGSTDKTAKLVASLSPPVRYIYQENKGPSAARNTGIINADGRYIAFLDSDDKFLPEKLEVVMKHMAKHPECHFLHSYYYNINKKGKRTKLRRPLDCKDKDMLRYHLLRRRFTIRTSTVVVDRKCFDKVGLFNEDYPYSQDWDMWLRLAKYYKADCIKKPLVGYRIHKSNRSSLAVSKYRPKILQDALKSYHWDEKYLKKLDKKYNYKKRKKG